MTWPPPAHPDDPVSAFLVERYISAATAADLTASTARVARLAADPDHAGDHVRYLCSVYLPSEDTCFCLFRAPSVEAVRSVNERAGFALDRVIDAILLPRTL